MGTQRKHKRQKRKRLNNRSSSPVDTFAELHKQAAPIRSGRNLKRLGELLLAVATLLGGISAGLTFLPRISVIASDPIGDRHAPFFNTFTISNDGQIGVRNLQVGCSIHDLGWDTPQKRVLVVLDVTDEYGEFHAEEGFMAMQFQPGEKHVTECRPMNYHKRVAILPSFGTVYIAVRYKHSCCPGTELNDFGLVSQLTAMVKPTGRQNLSTRSFRHGTIGGRLTTGWAMVRGMVSPFTSMATPNIKNRIEASIAYLTFALGSPSLSKCRLKLGSSHALVVSA
jgi:hypothetical protein